MHHSGIREEFDVVVIGGGGSGLAAALEARAAGRTVVLIEKNPALGGSTAWSVGSVTCSLTPHQIAAGIKDCPADHWEDMAGFNGDLDPRDNPALRRVLADHLPETFRWLLSHGVRFFGPMPEPPNRVARMHNVLPNSRAFIHHLGRAARKAGVKIRLSTRVIELIQEDGRVCGVRCDGVGGQIEFRARGGLVLAAGDFTNDPELKTLHMGPDKAAVEGVNPTATGDGQKLAIRLGAYILNGDLVAGPELRFIRPPRQSWLLRLPPWTLLSGFMAWALKYLPGAILRPFVMSFVTTVLAPSLTLFAKGAILVNRNGERFTDETTEPALLVAQQPDKIAYIVLDARIAGLYVAWPNYISTAPGIAYAYVADYARNRPDLVKSAATIEELAAKLSMPPSSLQAAISSAGSLGAGPYVALGPARAALVHNEGGLAVDLEHRVLRSDGTPIAGLYAAGSTGQGGLLLRGHGHHLAWAFTSGRRAGRHAAYAARQ
jgi:succinate dehydrogenase/fumarate reductase flavoprotein subunit